MTKSQILASMDVAMGGRAAEELIFGKEKVTGTPIGQNAGDGVDALVFQEVPVLISRTRRTGPSGW